jgi:hypothetical protein
VTAITELRSYLSNLPEGELANEYFDDVLERVETAWLELDGSTESKMTSQKVSRARAFLWQPPCLVFAIERHGGVVQGSSRAELQTWILDLDRRLATRRVDGYRQINARDGRLDIDAIAGELARDIRERRKNMRLQWIGEFRVRVYTEQAIPETNRQTTISRRKKFRVKLEHHLRPDWIRVKNGNRLVFEYSAE